jgi:hypothetical protein
MTIAIEVYRLLVLFYTVTDTFADTNVADTNIAYTNVEGLMNRFMRFTTASQLISAGE